VASGSSAIKKFSLSQGWIQSMVGTPTSHTISIFSESTVFYDADHRIPALFTKVRTRALSVL